MATPTAHPDAPVNTLTVPAKPALITGANIATLGATVAAAAGPAGLIAGGALAAGVSAVAAHKGAKRRATGRLRQQAERQRAARAAGAPANPQRAAPRGRKSSPLASLGGRKNRGRSPSLAGGAAGPSSGKGRRAGSPLGRLLGKPGQSGRGRKTPGGGTGAGRPAGAKPSPRPRTSTTAAPGAKHSQPHTRPRARGAGLIPKIGATSRALRNALRQPTARQAAAAARNGKGKGSRLGLGLTALAAGAVGARNSYRRARRWVRRRVLGKPDPKKPTRATKPRRHVARKLTLSTRSATTTRTTPAATRPKPGPTLTNPSNTTKGTTMDGLRQHAAQMYAYASVFEPSGMLGPIDPGGDFHDMPESLGFVRAAVGSLMEKATAKWPLDPSIAQVMSQVVQLLDTAAEASRRIPAAIEDMHKKELDRLRRPRPGEDKWDVSANR